MEEFTATSPVSGLRGIDAGERAILWTPACARAGSPNRAAARVQQGCCIPPSRRISRTSESPSSMGHDIGVVPSPNVEPTDWVITDLVRSASTRSGQSAPPLHCIGATLGLPHAVVAVRTLLSLRRRRSPTLRREPVTNWEPLLREPSPESQPGCRTLGRRWKERKFYFYFLISSC